MKLFSFFLVLLCALSFNAAAEGDKLQLGEQSALNAIDAFAKKVKETGLTLDIEDALFNYAQLDAKASVSMARVAALSILMNAYQAMNQPEKVEKLHYKFQESLIYTLLIGSSVNEITQLSKSEQTEANQQIILEQCLALEAAKSEFPEIYKSAMADFKSGRAQEGMMNTYQTKYDYDAVLKHCIKN